MTYEEAKDYLSEISHSGMVFGLETMQQLLARLDNPQEKLQFVHIAGTNGKGSTLAFISTILQCAGYTVGRYASPRVFEYEEFVQINGNNIEREALCRYVKQIKTVIASMEEEGLARPTLFEVETAIGFLYFVEMECDVVVLECGLGGRDDATNVVENVLCNVLTPIGLDHTGILGDTLEEITEAKAGIIKNRAPVCVGRQQKRARLVIEKVCGRVGCPLLLTDDSRLRIYDELEYAQDGAPMIHFDYKYFTDLKIRLIGRYQVDNACLAIEAAKVLDDWGLTVTTEHIKEGLEKAVWHGRFDTISKDPQVIIDGAHNPHGMKQLKQSLEYYFSGKRIFGIMGVLADKAYDEECEMIAPLFEKMFTITPPANPRALEAEKLAQVLKNYHSDVTACEDIETAVKAAFAKAKKDDVIVIFGSLSYIGEAGRAVRKNAGK
ncbi:MAG: folylpolyglutamate synthase/dihydrofolate synthase family protein [Lachnospiraceae bacterium]|nr:folylpolyglutamate synthase/dihydrofolate synthase family protein [Lachnospiraceae bacterium]